MDSIEFGSFSFDLNFVEKLANEPLHKVLSYIFFDLYGWVIFAGLLIWGLFQLWMFWRSGVFASKQSYLLLAIDIPKMNEQSPKAVENVFAALAGAEASPNLKEKYIDGYYQVGFSCEIVSIDGYVQFLMRSPVKFRELVEAAIYAQYPDAEITEVNDYAKAMDVKFPNDEWDLWGSDITLVRDYYYPIRTYPEFEHPLTQELKDPMANMLEVMNKIGKGEQIWFQILIVPVLGKVWKDPGVKQINKILGIKIAEKKSMLSKMTDAPLEFLQMVNEQVTGGGSPTEGDTKSDANMVAYLPPQQKAEIEGIARKISKIGYQTKIRFIYLAKKEVMKKGLGVSGMFGAIKQFNTEDLNAMKPHPKTKTVAAYIGAKKRKARKQNSIMSFYKARSIDSYGAPFYMNIEELASLYHFPTIEVKAPLVQKIDSKKGGAPIGLPTEIPEDRPAFGEPPKEEKEKEPEFEPVVDFDTDDFEKRFAKDKTGETTKARKRYVKKKYDIEKKKATRRAKKKKQEEPEPEEKANEDVPDNLPFV